MYEAGATFGVWFLRRGWRVGVDFQVQGKNMADHGSIERERQDILITSKMEAGVENKRALLERIAKDDESC